MNKHTYPSADIVVIAFASAILTKKSVPKGMVFRLVANSGEQIVMHVDAHLLFDPWASFKALKDSRVKTTTDENFDSRVNKINMDSMLSRKHTPRVSEFDFVRKSSCLISNFICTEQQNGMRLTATFEDGAMCSFFCGDYLVYKLLDVIDRFFELSKGAPLIIADYHGEIIQ
ncbi:MAG: hypothetical protein ACLGSA_11290 [Acidobacteriota bacterium]